MEVRLESTEGSGRAAEVWVGGHLLVVMDEYSAPGEPAGPGLLDDVKFTYMTEQRIDWDQAAAANRAERKLIEHVRSWRYVGCGQVTQIMPVTIDFGLLTMEDANWSSDEQLVGAYVRVPIDRLSITRRLAEDWNNRGQSPIISGDNR